MICAGGEMQSEVAVLSYLICRYNMVRVSIGHLGRLW